LLDALLVILGPTGVGKTEVAVELAKRIRAEIISADSRQIYKEMDIGTAKPSSAVRQKVPHHLIDLVFPDEIFDAAGFKARAEAIIKELQEKDKLPILVGGSGLYIKAVMDGLFIGPGADWKLREKLKKRRKKKALELSIRNLSEWTRLLLLAFIRMTKEGLSGRWRFIIFLASRYLLIKHNFLLS